MSRYAGTNNRTQRNLNNAFAYDLVPSPSVIIAALKAARRVNDFPTAVRIFEGTYIHAQPAYFHTPQTGRPERETRILTMCVRDIGIEMKVENRGQYEEYLKELEPIREELGISLKETMYPEGTSSGRDYDFGAYQAH